ncbi:Uncharacterized protein family UPF0102 [Elusimicrobium minutum Pei191]|uniref:UPF0102 protein Emin_0629 n=1 Tax=Elusimicrobium minutum (strain Pei191) TaxID=445932 RepID=B2KC57_ELUMP|nr:YraN family protein [Elusimicrobium minutum]ACC98184.1 Uncharacterized protein family UPF0102 [Elusimicrobium minutum Pei191]
MNKLGVESENAAANFLKKNGYKIIARNYAVQTGEVDIIASQGGLLKQKTLVFIEVKGRAYKAYGGPLAAVTKAKQNKIISAATIYVKENFPKFDSIRFDVVTVVDGKIEHIENAFIPQRGTL